MTAKYAAADGAVLWEKRFSGVPNTHQGGRAIAVTSNGDVVVAGVFDLLGYIAKYASADGAKLWDVPAGAVAMNIVVDAMDDVVVASYSYTAKYAGTNGTLIWDRPFIFSGQGHALALDSRGNAVVTGIISKDSDNFYYTIKYAATNGALLWEKISTTRTNGSSTPVAIAIDAQDNVFVTGASFPTNNADFYTIKYSGTNGAVLWSKLYNGPSNRDDYAKAIAVNEAGNVIVAGVTLNSSWDWCLIQYAGADGSVIWEKHYNGPTDGEELLPDRTSLAVGLQGRIAVAGSCRIGQSVSADYTVAMYREFALLPSVTTRRNGDGLELWWPADYQGWWLEAQTNQSDLGLTTNWATVHGSASTNMLTFPFIPSDSSVYFRLLAH